MSAPVEVDPAALDEVVVELESVAEAGDALPDPSGFGAAGVTAAAERVHELLDAGGRALAEGLGDVADRARAAADLWRVQDAGMVDDRGA